MRLKLIDAIVEKSGGHNEALKASLRFLADNDLISFAQEIGIDTDVLLSQKVS